MITPNDPEEKRIDEEVKVRHHKGLRGLFVAFAVLVGVFLLTALVSVVITLPPLGEAKNPDNNEVSKRYIESGLEETGAVNMVAGMILDYRAFDTFGESCVLFVATICVMIMLRIDKKRERESESEGDSSYEPKHDLIIQKTALFLVPVILVYGIYVILNGHISPGGGFSGGSIMGAGLVLYLNAFGFEKTEKFLNARSVKWITFGALIVYGLAKSYSFFTGANHLESGIPLGTPGAILSSGLILILNICVGLVVACTMYSFFALVRRGKI